LANTKISAGTDPGPLLGTDRLPLARSPSTTAFAATVAEIASYASTVAATPSFNYADNSGFSVNQRTYISGAALAAGIYGFDRWKAGAGGCTLTFTASPPSTTVTITAGTLQQVVEGASVQGGNYMLSWVGTAQGRVGAGAYAVSPVAVTGATAGANLTIEFNAGTLSQVKFGSGTVATAWQAKAARDELSNCQRFFMTGNTYGFAYGVAGNPVHSLHSLPVTMRGVPAVNVLGTPTYSNSSGLSLTPVDQSVFITSFTVTATATCQVGFSYTASADP